MTTLLADIWVEDLAPGTAPPAPGPTLPTHGIAVPDEGRAGPAYLLVSKAGISTIVIWGMNTEDDWGILDTVSLATLRDEYIRIADGSAYLRLASQNTAGVAVGTKFGFGQSPRGL